MRFPAQQQPREVEREVVRRRVRTVRVTELALEAEVDDPIDLRVGEVARVRLELGSSSP
jgi:hypothetical protein